MDIDEALHLACTSHEPLRALIAERIYPDDVPERVTLPYVMRTWLSQPGVDDLDGECEGRNGTLQLTVAASSSPQRSEVVRALRGALVHRALGPIDDIRVIDESPDVDERDDGSLRSAYLWRMDIEVWWQQPAAGRTRS